MGEGRNQQELLNLLRKATVRLQDPQDRARWGTGFFIASDVILTCWHVVRDVKDKRVLVQQPRPNATPDQNSLFWNLGEATLLEEGTWDLALLRIAASGDNNVALIGEPGSRVVLPLQEHDPGINAKLVTTAFPEDGASRHDATYDAGGLTTPLGHTREFLRIKSDGVVPGFSGSALVDLDTWRVCGVIARNDMTGGANDGGLAVPIKIFREAFQLHGEVVLQRNAKEHHPAFSDTIQHCGRSYWNWPTLRNYFPYREEKRKGFVGREWLFEEVRAWATNAEAEQAMLIYADYGVGKSAFLAELIDSKRAGLPVLAQHFCHHDSTASLSACNFVGNLAAQFLRVLPAYRELLEADDADRLRRLLDGLEGATPDCLEDFNEAVKAAFDEAVVAPLCRIPAPTEQHLLVVDALDEAQDPRANVGPTGPITIVQLLAQRAKRLPRWLKVLATSRPRPDVLTSLRQAFSLKELDAEESRNLDDLRCYVVARCRNAPLAKLLDQAGLAPAGVAEFLSSKKQSKGKFLYVVGVLNDLVSELLPLTSQRDLETLPPGLDGFYRDTFERRFPPEEAYGPVGEILAVLAEQREPLGRRELAAILGRQEQQISESLRPLRDLLRLRPLAIERDGGKTKEVLHSFDHLTLEQWLSETDDLGDPRAGRFAVNRQDASKRLHIWALAESGAGRAHIWPYLARHLPSHLREVELSDVLGPLLLSFPWLQARLEAVGINALLADFQLVERSPALVLLERALRHSLLALAHTNSVISREEQFCSQILARLRERDEPKLLAICSDAECLIRKAGGAVPLSASLKSSALLQQRLQRCKGSVDKLQALPDGKLASFSVVYLGGPSLTNIQLWGPEHQVLVRHEDDLNATVYCNRISYLKPLSNDKLGFVDLCQHKGYIWDTPRIFLSVLEDPLIGRLEVLSDGTLATASSKDGTIKLWGGVNQDFRSARQAHLGCIKELFALPQGYLVSISNEHTNDQLALKRYFIRAQGVATVKIWSSKDSKLMLSDIKKYPNCSIDKLISLQDGYIAFTVKSGFGTEMMRLTREDGSSYTRTVHHRSLIVWNPSAEFYCSFSIKMPGTIRMLIYVYGSLLAYVCENRTIKLLDVVTGDSKESTCRVNKKIQAMVALPCGYIAFAEESSSVLRIWDFSNDFHQEIQTDSHAPIISLLAHPNGMLYAGKEDGWIYIFNVELLKRKAQASGLAKAHSGSIRRLVELQNGDIASECSAKVMTWEIENLTCSCVCKGRLDDLPPCSTLRKVDLPADIVREVEAGNVRIRAAVKLPDKRTAFFALISRLDTYLCIYNPRSNRLYTHRVSNDYRNCIELVGLSDGRLVSVHPHADVGIEAWDSANLESTPHQILPGDTRSLIVLPTDQIVSGSADGEITLLSQINRTEWKKKLIFTADHEVTALLYVDKKSILVAGDASGCVHFLDMCLRRDY